MSLPSEIEPMAPLTTEPIQTKNNHNSTNVVHHMPALEGSEKTFASIERGLLDLNEPLL